MVLVSTTSNTNFVVRLDEFDFENPKIRQRDNSVIFKTDNGTHILNPSSIEEIRPLGKKII